MLGDFRPSDPLIAHPCARTSEYVISENFCERLGITVLSRGP